MEKQLRGDLREAILKRLEVEKRTLSLLINEINKEKKDLKVETLENRKVLAIILKEVKKRNQSIDMFTKGNRPELAAREEQEILVLEKYLPKAPSYEEVVEVVKKKVSDDPNIHPGKLTGMLNKEFEGLVSIVDIKKAIEEVM